MTKLDDIDKIPIDKGDRAIQDVLRRIKQGTYILTPDFQRDFVWDNLKQSKLIESVLMGIPLPVFYLLEKRDGNIMIVDGLQRLKTFYRFESNEFNLTLPDNDELNGRSFSDLSMKLQERFLECNLTVYVIQSKVSEERCYDIFDRVNSGEPLTRQQMRNCLCNGKGTRFLREVVETDIFKRATGESLKSKNMQDREWVNRFCAFQILSLEEYEQFRPVEDRTDKFLSKSLKIMNDWDDQELEQLCHKFCCSLENNFHLFGAHAFRKSFLKHETVTLSQRERTPLVMSLWDVMITVLSRYSAEDVRIKSEPLRREYRRLLNDSRFLDSIDNYSHTPKKIKVRFQMVSSVLGGILENQSP